MIAGIALIKGIENIYSNDKSDFEKIEQLIGLRYELIY